MFEDVFVIKSSVVRVKKKFGRYPLVKYNFYITVIKTSDRFMSFQIKLNNQQLVADNI